MAEDYIEGGPDDTIAAVSTARGPGAIGIVRLSGADAIAIAAKLFRGRAPLEEAEPRKAMLGTVEHGGRVLDQALALVMPGPGSYTGEDMVELHCHGGPAVLDSVLRALLDSGARPAGPGEFTRRAFLNGRIDLVRAEAVADMVQSATRAAARAAAGQLAGGLSDKIRDIDSALAETLALLEAGIDFAEEEDVVAIERHDLEARLGSARAKIAGLVAHASRGALLREGAVVVIAGRVNSGKSTLMNRLLGSERVIVSEEPGATRDAVEDRIEVAGIPVRLFDTAGIRKDAGGVESAGMRKTREIVGRADLALLLADGSRPLAPEDLELRRSIEVPLILVVNKIDLGKVPGEDELDGLAVGRPRVDISALTGQGVGELEAALALELAGGEIIGDEPPLLTNARHALALADAGRALAEAEAAIIKGLSDEYIAADLRRARQSLGLVTGESAGEEILDMIFSRFCVGK